MNARSESTIKAMQINIYPSKKISEVQAEFHSEFPFLKLEFFRNLKKRENSPLSPELSLGKIQPETPDGLLQFEKNTTVGELEHRLQSDFKLNAQVFRLSGNVWLETTLTDQWTLQKQNEHGRELSQAPSEDSAEDFDLLRDDN